MSWPGSSSTPRLNGDGSPSTAFFDETADFFDRFAETAAHRERQQRFLEVGRISLATSSTERPLCLDLGCGPGAITLGLAGLGFDMIGVDSSSAMIERATAAGEAVDVGNRCTFIQADLGAFLGDFRREADLIVSSSVFEYLEDPVRILELVAARLRSGGTFAVSVPNRRSLYRRVEPALLYVVPRAVRYARETRNTMDAGELVASARTFGLEPVETSHFGQLVLMGRPVLGRFSRAACLGTLTLVVLVKR